MSSILPQIESLQDVPFAHAQYAEGILNLMLNKLLEDGEYDIGAFFQGEQEGSMVAFDGDDFENVQAELRYVDYKFVIVVSEHSDENFASQFSYKIFEGARLDKMIPDKLRADMIRKANGGDDEIDFKLQ